MGATTISQPYHSNITELSHQHRNSITPHTFIKSMRNSIRSHMYCIDVTSISHQCQHAISHQYHNNITPTSHRYHIDALLVLFLLGTSCGSSHVTSRAREVPRHVPCDAPRDVPYDFPRNIPPDVSHEILWDVPGRPTNKNHSLGFYSKKPGVPIVKS